MRYFAIANKADYRIMVEVVLRTDNKIALLFSVTLDTRES